MVLCNIWCSLLIMLATDPRSKLHLGLTIISQLKISNTTESAFGLDWGGTFISDGRDADGHPRQIRARWVLTGLTPPQAQGGEKVTGEQIHEVLKEIDTNHNGQVEVEEYLQVKTAKAFSTFECANPKPKPYLTKSILECTNSFLAWSVCAFWNYNNFFDLL